MQLLTFNILTTSVLAFPQAALNSEHLRVIRDVQPEGESAPEPEAEMGILSPADLLKRLLPNHMIQIKALHYITEISMASSTSLPVISL